MKNIFEKIRELCGYREIVIKYAYTRDGGHGDMINQILVMLTYNGVDPYYIVNGKFTIYEEEDGFECALLYCDSNLDDMLNELYEKIKAHLKENKND
jgi:hypothetical protein